MGSPWEVELAVLLLRERLKGGSSKWAWFISLLPTYVSLPFFFSEMELSLLEDGFVLDEIDAIREFISRSFKLVPQAEVRNVKFSLFAWAISIVYSMSCKTESGIHFLSPVLGRSNTGSAVFLSVGEHLKLVSRLAIEAGHSISLYREKSTQTDTFIFQGAASETLPDDWQPIFKDMDDLCDWYFKHYGGVNSNRYLTTVVAKDALEKLGRKISTGQQLSVGFHGQISKDLICVFASLHYAKGSIQMYNKDAGSGESPIDFSYKAGSRWENLLGAIAQRSLFYSVEMQLRTGNTTIDRSLAFATEAAKRRVYDLTSSYSTSSVEDRLWLQAAAWEGTEVEGSCTSCRFQNERMSSEEVSITAFQTVRKEHLIRFLSLTGKNNPEDFIKTSSRQCVAPAPEAALQQFSSWCEKGGFSISDKLGISLTPNYSSGASHEQELVRGVMVLNDIEEGETLCTLPLDAGLFDNSVESSSVADSWDLAAARLLQEQALGNASPWAEYIAILPRDMPSPAYLRSSDLHEVQWLPAIRELVQLRRAIRKSYRWLKPSQIAFADYEQYEWAALMVHSRAFTLPVLPDDKYSHYVLMPYMDMINHHYVYQADWMSQPVVDRKLEIVAKRSLKKGEQLFASFGPRSNDNLFLYYGFVLQDNPFDTAQLFKSFKDAVLWFLRAWTGLCTSCPGADISCTKGCSRNFSESIWPSVKQRVEEFEGGGAGPSKEWSSLITAWADYGYQYLPYQPSPSIYAYGVSDPSLLAAFEAVSELLHYELQQQQRHQEEKEVGGRLQDFIHCMGALRRPTYVPLLGREHSCESHLKSALLLVEGDERRHFIAKAAIAVRCMEVLASFPTSIVQDELLLKQHSSRFMRLVREYRYRKKLLLKEVLNKMISLD